MFADAEAYERFMGRWSRLVAPLLAGFANLSPGGSVLDVGSGTGALTFAIAERDAAARVTGVDPSMEYVGYASASNPYPGRATFEAGDAQSLRFGNGSFDAAVSLLVFNFIPDPAKALREVRRVTRPGGTVTAAVWDYADGMRMLRIFWDAAVALDHGAAQRDENRMPLCRAGQLRELWTRGGLENVQEAPIDIRMKFASRGDYWDPFLLGQGPAGAYASGLSKERAAALRAEVERRLPKPAPDGSFELGARVWAVRGAMASG